MPWANVKGHDALKESFQRVIQRGRLAHGYLFTGPRGVGKSRFAIELARALLCENRIDEKLEPCDRCPSCKQIDARSHPDFIYASRPPESLEFPIAVMREVCQKFGVKSARGKGKVAIIDDADDLNEESANCFLKTLEEPPPKAVILVITSSPDRQLQTIVSRCQTVRFAPVSREQVLEILKERGVDNAERMAALSGGSPGLALSLSDPDLWDFRRKWLKSLSAPKIPSVKMAKEWTRFVESAGKESAAQRGRATQCLSLLITFLEDVLNHSLGRKVQTGDPEEDQAIQAFAQRLTAEQILSLIDRCLESDKQIDRRAQLVLILEALMDAIAQRLKARAV